MMSAISSKDNYWFAFLKLNEMLQSLQLLLKFEQNLVPTGSLVMHLNEIFKRLGLE